MENKLIRALAKVMLVCVVVALACMTSVFAIGEDSNLIMTSPYYGQGISTESASVGIESYAAQLGVVADSVVAMTAEQRTLTAISSGDYPVTPGDLYQLSYMNGQTPISYELQVDGACSVTVPGTGVVDGAGLSFAQMQKAVESLVLMYYPYSLPQCKLIGTGVFAVIVKGEVSSTQRVPAWGLSRLSSVVQYATPYASTRAVTIEHQDGSSSSYDLYQSMREGVLDQDPLLAPGDVVIFEKAERVVTVNGEVYKPGTYQPLEGQELFTLLYGYGGGLLSSADLAKVRVERFDSTTGRWNAIFVNGKTDGNFQLKDLDRVFVEKLVPTSETVSIEGAVSVQGTNETSVASLTNLTSGKMFYQFYPGETVLDMLRAISNRFTMTSDLESIYLVRNGQMIPVNAQSILYGNGKGGDLVLQSGDKFVVPFNQMYVTVSGAVTKPSTFAYVPDRPVSYYLALAGGITSDAKKTKSIKITDAKGNKLDENSVVPPESIISVERNTVTNDISKTVAIVGIVSSVITIVATVVSILVQTHVI